MARIGIVECMLHGHLVADFADHDDVGCLAHRVAQCLVKRQGVESDLALVDHTLFVGVQELDRILNRQDVAWHLRIAVIKHGGQGGRFARTRGAHDQNEPALEQDQLLQNRWHFQVGNRGNAAFDIAHHHADFAPLHEYVEPEAPEVWHADGQVAFELGFELAHLRLVHH